MRKEKLSVVIPTYNVEYIIPHCLESLKWADEIVIVDMFSSDKTVDICKKYSNVKIHQWKDRVYSTPSAINYGISKVSEDINWILRHDSDEIITPELRNEILHLLETGKINEYDGYFIADKTYFFGKWIPSAVPGKGGREKLFKKGYFEYEVKREHEHPIIKGKWGYLKNIYLHYTTPTLAHILRKIIYYAERDAERLELSTNINSYKPWYIFYRTIKAMFSLYTKGKLYKYGGHGVILSLVFAFKFFCEESFRWEKRYKKEHWNEIKEIEEMFSKAQLWSQYK